ncbi:MAG: hypothetical protein K8S13_01705 [Desulfobacula sp.]|nr:hypothetical protein [Desulfobacula sp.]MCD4718564.1 hypothetical protein [Desulfobacula sp.]
MIARTYEGKEVSRQSKIYMPHPARFGITDRMGRGPYEKSGMIRDTALPPLRPVRETFEVVFPYKDTQEGNRILTTDTMEVEVRLVYLPFGEANQDHFVWKISKHQVHLDQNL